MSAGVGSSRVNAEKVVRQAAQVLIAEEDPRLAAQCRAAFKTRNCAVHVALNGPDALDVIRKVRLDLVLLSATLPRLSGFEILRQIRGEDSHEGLFIILAVEAGQEQDVFQGDAAGADMVLPKPINVDDLSAILGSA